MIRLIWILTLGIFISCDQGEWVRVDKIIDGDTIVCDGKKVRLIGIDAPESKPNQHMSKQRSLGDNKIIMELGKRSKEFVESIIPPGTMVRLEYDVDKTDRYGRILAYVWLRDGRMLNEVILENGYAMLYTVPPNLKYENRLRRTYEKARSEGRGLWGD